MNHPPDSSKPRPSKIYSIIVAEARNWNDEKGEFFEGISRTIVIGRDETRTVGTLEISTDSRLSQQREDRLTFIRCRVAPRNMHEIRWKRARYAFRTERNDAVFPINTRIHPSAPTRRRE